ncbi:hypothetical protein V8E54_006513 [Elaphomyces granulatus]|jgi:hypothetical protein
MPLRSSGEALKARPLDESDVRATRGRVGPCTMARSAFANYRERWEFWKLRFSKVKDEVDEEVAEIVQQALSEMERAMKKRDLDLFGAKTCPSKRPRNVKQEKLKGMDVIGEGRTMRCLIF